MMKNEPIGYIDILLLARPEPDFPSTLEPLCQAARFVVSFVVVPQVVERLAFIPAHAFERLLACAAAFDVNTISLASQVADTQRVAVLLSEGVGEWGSWDRQPLEQPP